MGALLLAALFAGAVVGVNYTNKNKKEAARPIKAEKYIYVKPAVVRLAKMCRRGDPSAMRAMADVLRGCCPPELTALLDRYETEPTPEHEAEIRQCGEISIWGKGYMMWLVRAALYKDADAAARLDRWPLYKEFAYIPYDMMTGKDESGITFWDSSVLKKIGFTDVPGGCTDCRLFYDADKKIFDLFYVSDYEPPDEDGFGAEWDYDNIYFDEFFNRLPVKSQEAGCE